MNICVETNARDFVQELDGPSASELISALVEHGHIDDPKQVRAEAAEEAERNAETRTSELLEEIRELLDEGRPDEVLLLIERELYPRRGRPTDAELLARAA